MNIRKPADIPELTTADMARWWAKVWRGPETDCWIWIGARTSFGYGQIFLRGRPAMWLAHRVGYTYMRGAIPEGFVLMHVCDNPSCVNPAHLTTGSHAENTWDHIQKGRHRGCVEVVAECPF